MKAEDIQTDTQTKRRQRHREAGDIKTKGRTEVMHLKAQANQGLLEATESPQRDQGPADTVNSDSSWAEL